MRIVLLVFLHLLFLRFPILVVFRIFLSAGLVVCRLLFGSPLEFQRIGLHVLLHVLLLLFRRPCPLLLAFVSVFRIVLIFLVAAEELNSNLYPFQNDLCRWGLKRGKAALFTMTGTGKTPMQSVWGDAVSQYDGRGAVLMLAPLAVSKQTAKQMGEKFNIDIRQCRDQKDIGPGLNITNYEMLHHFSPDGLAGIVLDESSIIKAFNGKTRTQIIDFSRDIPFRLACTATPSPNDYMELGNHAEFLGIMSYTEMLATFFVHDGVDTSKWRLKGHAENAFWELLASLGVFLIKLSDIVY